MQVSSPGPRVTEFASIGRDDFFFSYNFYSYYIFLILSIFHVLLFYKLPLFIAFQKVWAAISLFAVSFRESDLGVKWAALKTPFPQSEP